tara:strand:+ start:10649 stop:13789 length:3141 start_codon:yes stop_codon:yes gene_type:complete
MTKINKLSIIATLIAGLIASSHAYKRDADVIKITKSNRTEALSPEEQLKMFQLADGFVIELVASEKNGIINPIDLTFDDAGRLWTQTAEMYPLDPMGDEHNRHIRGQVADPNSKIHQHPEMVRIKRLYQLKDQGTDRIVVIDDPTKPVEGQVRQVARGLTMPQSILPYKNGVYVAHGSEMLYLSDEDGDGIYEKPTTVLTGFSFIDSHTMSHLLTRAPGGWINFSHGAMNLGEVTAVASGAKQQINYCKIARFSLDGRRLELVASGLNNIWGYQLRANGQWWGSEANDKGMSIVPMEAMTGYLGIGNDKLRAYQPMMPQLHSFRVGGTGLSGLEFSEDDAGGFPDEWKEVALLANPITNTINRVKVDRDASGAVIATHLEDLLKCEDDWFRPVNLEFGPDGCLYIADWYNKVVSHNEIPRTDPSRDKTHGRIWRVRHVSQKPGEIPNLIEAKDEDLAQSLTGPSRWEKRAAWHQIADRQATVLLPEIKDIALKADSLSSRIHAIWAYESLGEFDESFVRNLLQDEDHNIRREIIRSLASFDLAAAQVTALLGSLIEDEHCTVRSQVLRTLAEVGKADSSTIKLLITASKPPLTGKNEMGGVYERDFERFLARVAMEKYSDEVEAFLNSAELSDYPASNVLWALQSLGEESFVELFPKIWSVQDGGGIPDELFVSLATVIKNPTIQSLVAPAFSDPENYKAMLDLLLGTQDRMDSLQYKQLYGPILSALANDPETDRTKLYQAGRLLKAEELRTHALEFISQDKSAATLRIVLPILMLNPGRNMSHLKTLASDDTLSFAARLEAVDAYNRANPKAGTGIISPLLSGLEGGERSAAVNRLSMSTQGAQTLAQLVGKKVIAESDFNYLAATRMSDALRRNPTAIKLMKTWAKKKAQENSMLTEKVERYAEAIAGLEGNPIVGQGLFQGCLACHAVGDQGHSIAPALDGSAARETHALLTAIMIPDAAVEGGYELYRVIRRDGPMEEGYLSSSNEHGVTLATMGNQQVFIPRRDVLREAGVAGKSFMLAMYKDLPEQTMADLLEYISTLK